jgi:hypothetical protein
MRKLFGVLLAEFVLVTQPESAADDFCIRSSAHRFVASRDCDYGYQEQNFRDRHCQNDLLDTNRNNECLFAGV